MKAGLNTEKLPYNAAFANFAHYICPMLSKSGEIFITLSCSVTEAGRPKKGTNAEQWSLSLILTPEELEARDYLQARLSATGHNVLSSFLKG